MSELAFKTQTNHLLFVYTKFAYKEHLTPYDCIAWIHGSGESLLQINLIETATVCEVIFVGFFPATKCLLNGEQGKLGQLL